MTLYLPPRQYHSISDLLYGLNRVLSDNVNPWCDMFFYYDGKKKDSEIVFPQRVNESDNLFDIQSHYKKRFRQKGDSDKAPIMETPDMKNKPETITFGGGSEYFDLHIVFCKELAILLGIVETLRSSVPAILPGWSVKTKHVNLLGTIYL